MRWGGPNAIRFACVVRRLLGAPGGGASARHIKGGGTGSVCACEKRSFIGACRPVVVDRRTGGTSRGRYQSATVIARRGSQTRYVRSDVVV